MSKIGFIGLGVMGRPMACNLARAGVDLLVNDIRQDVADKAAAEFDVTAAPAEEIAKSCDFIFTILPNGKIAREVIAGDDGLLANIRAGAVVVDMSSVTPQDSIYCAQRLGEKGTKFLDAPVSGGEEGAIKGSLAIMVGGEQDTYDSAKVYFDILGSRSVLVGGTGAGSITKLVNQIIVNMNIATVAEAMVFAKKAGVDPQRAFDAIRCGLAGSQVLEDKAPRMMSGSFRPGGSITVNHKDIGNVLSTARDMCIPVPLSASLFEIMQSLKLHGFSGEDHAAIVRHFMSLADIESL